MGKTFPVRVLIVDDQEPFLSVARAVVESTAGFQVVGEARSGEAAIEVMDNAQPDLVLMDVNLPGISGSEAARRILERARGVVVFLLSTYEEEDYAPRAVECGAAAYIPKSAFGPHALRAAWLRSGYPPVA